MVKFKGSGFSGRAVRVAFTAPAEAVASIMLLAGLLPQGTGNLRFSTSRWPGDQHIFVTVNISTGQQLYQ